MHKNPSPLRRTVGATSGRGGWRPLLALAALSVVSALSGCQMRGKDRPLSSEAPPPPVFADAKAPAFCRAAEVRYALGQPITQELLQELVAKTGAARARTVSVDDPGTKDVNEQRLTVDVDAAGRVVGARCS